MLPPVPAPLTRVRTLAMFGVGTVKDAQELDPGDLDVLVPGHVRIANRSDHVPDRWLVVNRFHGCSV